MSTRLTPGSGAILKPFFNSSYGIEKIDVVVGGSGYASTDPPKITVEGTQTPSVEGVFYPVIDNTGIGSITEIVIFKGGAGYFPVFSTTTSGSVSIERGVFGTVAAAHTAGVSSIFTGDFNIIDDEIHFSAPPYGKQGPVGLKTGSTFSGRMFSRKLNPYETSDYNVVLDDISLDFTGVAGTQFALSENQGIVTSLFNSVNAGSDIGNNPFILINNVIQTPGLDFEIVDKESNDINFLSGVPRAGRIQRVGLQTGCGFYYPLKGSGRVGINSSGNVSIIELTGGGQGYRTPPDVRITSAEGGGAIATAYLGVNTTTTVAISTATYNHQLGIMTFTTSSAHNLVEGDRVRVIGAGITVVQSLPARNISTFAYTFTTGVTTVTCDDGHYIGTGANANRHVLIEGLTVTDGAGITTLFREDGYEIVSIASTQQFEINTGIGTTTYDYASGGTVKSGIDTNILEGRNLVGFDLLDTTTDTFTAFVGINSLAHNYVTGGTVTKAQAGIITGFEILDAGSNYFIPKKIAYVDYDASSGVTTITAHGDPVGVVTTIANVYYTASTGIATIQSQYLHGLSTGDVVKLAGIGFSTPYGDKTYPLNEKAFFEVTRNNNIDFSVNLGISTLGIHTHQFITGTYQAFGSHGVDTDEFVVATGVAMTTKQLKPLKFANITYDNVTGIATVTTRRNHNLSERDFIVLSGIAFTCDYSPSHSISTAVYDNISGIMTITTATPHGYTEGGKAGNVVLTGLGFTCDIDNGASIHYYPRHRDDAYNTAVGIGSTSATTIQLDVGISPYNESYAHTFASATTGAIVSGGDYPHSFVSAAATAIIKGGEYSHTFVSAGATAVILGGEYPHTFVSAGSTAIITGGDYAHTFVSAGATAIITGGGYDHTFLPGAENSGCIVTGNSWYSGPFITPNSATYNPNTGILVLGFANPHGLTTASTIGIKTSSLVFTCTLDNNATEHAYPRPTDPIGQGQLDVPVAAVPSSTQIEVQVGISTIVYLQPTSATYDGQTGIVNITFPNHGLEEGQHIKVTRDSLVFTCELDGHNSTHSYPRAGDPIDGTNVAIAGTSQNAFEINVGASPLVYKTATNAVYNPVAGIMTITSPGHGLFTGSHIRITDNSFVFTCSQDDNATEHTYPRSTDPISGVGVSIGATTLDTFEIEVGVTTTTYIQPTNAVYNPVTGQLTVIAAGHGLDTTRSVRFTDNSFTFTCDMDNHGSNHTYPRSTDPISNTRIGIAATSENEFIVNVGVSTHTFSQAIGADYNAATGIMTVTTDKPHGLRTGTSIRLAVDGFVFTCGMDDHQTEHTYPRQTDPATVAGRVSIAATTTNTFTVNVGPTTSVSHNVTGASYSPTTGLMDLTIGAGHGLVVENPVRILPESLVFTCTKDGNATEHRYPQGGDPYFNSAQISKVTSNTVVEINVGPSTTPSNYIGGGTIQGAILAPREQNNSTSGRDVAAHGAFVKKVGSGITFTVQVGPSTVPHNYNRGGTVQRAFRYPIPYVQAAGMESVQFGDGQHVLEKIDNANFRVQSGILTSPWYFSKGGTVERPITLDVHEPPGYFALPLVYNPNATGLTTTGIGQSAIVDVRINVDGNIGEFDITEEGVGYKVEDGLTVVGIVTDPRVGVHTDFQLEVIEIGNDKFFGFYPGQFVLFDDIAPFFNGSRTKFTLSVTNAGVTEILSLKTIEGSDMDVTNNIFIYINDILQTPGEAYTWKGSRVIFTEAPKPGSKCSVFYYRGSSIDVEEIEPIPTVQPGDEIQIKENKLDVLDRDQFPRTTKRIVASDMLETFTYDSLGISTDQDAERPLSWVKQKSDKIISGVYYSKDRLNYKSKITPATRIIKNVGSTDDQIWVQNAFPVFSEVDLLTEQDRHIQIFEEREIDPAIITATVSTSSSISALSIASSGAGYLNVTNPDILVSSSKITKKDPMKDWKFDVITGDIGSADLREITQSEPIIAVGTSSRYINTLSGFFWERGVVGFGGTTTLNAVATAKDVTYSPNHQVMIVGEYASAARAVSYGDTVGQFEELQLLEQRQIPSIGVSVDYPTTFSREFNDVIWDNTAGSWIAIGFGGSVFTGVGIGTTTLYSQFSGTLETLHGIVYAQDEYVAVGNGGAIISSNVGKIWNLKTSNTNKNLRDIMYDGSRFIAVGDNGTIVTSTDKNFWFPFSDNLPAGTTAAATFDFEKIRYDDGLYVGITTVGELYYSLDLANWNYRDNGQSQPVGDLVFSNFGLDGRLLVVGGSGTAYYAEPVLNRATATCAVTNGGVSTAIIVNGGFGYDVGSNPPVVVGSDVPKKETVYSFKTEGDFGRIVGMSTFVTGIGFSVPPKLEFYLKSEFNDNTNLGYGFSSLNTFGINNSQLQIGDYFIIYDSPVTVGHALTGISTHVGGYNNYPTNKVGIISAGEKLNGLFQVDKVSVPDTVSGIVTVTCSFQPGPNSNSQIQVGIGTTAISDYYGKYSWGRIYDFQNRISGNPENFIVNPDAGLVGLSTAAQIFRTRPLT